MTVPGMEEMNKDLTDSHIIINHDPFGNVKKMSKDLSDSHTLMILRGGSATHTR
jgi:hypothetical protein